MIGAIIGDIVGSRYESGPAPEKDFKLFTRECHFTDDTVCTVAIADAAMNGKPYLETLHQWCRRYPHAGYGRRFSKWIQSDSPQPNNSYGNGSAMRVSAIGWMFDDYRDVLEQAKLSAEVSHSHPEGIKGAQCVAELIFWLRNMRINKDEVERKVKKFFDYDIPTMRDIRRISSNGYFDASCQETVPMAIRCFLDASSFEDTIRQAVMADGDTDTKAAIAGSIAEAYYEIPEWMVESVISYLPKDMLIVLEQFFSLQAERMG